MNRTKWGDNETKNEIRKMNPEYDKFDDDGNIIFDITDGTPVVIDRRVLYELSRFTQEFKIGNDIYKYRERDHVGLTGIEHIANKKHNFKVQDIPYIEKCLNKQEFVYQDKRIRNNRSIYLSGNFGANNEPYLKVVLDINSKTIITSFPARKINEPQQNKLSTI